MKGGEHSLIAVRHQAVRHNHSPGDGQHRPL